MSGQGEALFPVPDDGAREAILLQLAELGSRVALLEDLLADEPDRAGYRPIPAPKWWQVEGEERAGAIARLAGWVDQVYRPSYGHLAAKLPVCWREHAFCLFVLDWLSELHSVLYLRVPRTAGMLSSQGEWHVRHLPAVADLMAAEGRSCQHARSRVNGAVR